MKTKRKTLWGFWNMDSDKLEFIHAGNQRSASAKLKAGGIRFRDLAIYKEVISPPP